MTAAVSRLPPHLQPRSKASATTTSSPTTIAKPPSPPSRPRYSSAQISEAVTDRATVSLIRRVLCSAAADKSADIHELLPPLTSSNEVDLQVYGLVAVVIKEFIHAWYSKITPHQGFVEEIVRVIAHVTRALEQRVRKIDLERLLFDELPELIDAHIRAYRIAHYPMHPPPYEEDPRQIYHSLWPSPALSPVPDPGIASTIAIQKENEAAYRDLLIQGILAVLLPTEDLESGCLTSLVGGILSDMILGNGVGGKASEPWLIWEGITKIVEVIKEPLSNTKTTEASERLSSHILEPKEETVTLDQTRLMLSTQKVFWLVLQYAFLAFTTTRLIITTIVSSSTLPTRSGPYTRKSSTTITTSGQLLPSESPFSVKSSQYQMSTAKQTAKQPIISMKIWPFVSNLLELNGRIPWLCATISFLQYGALHGTGRVGDTDGIIDKLLHTHVTLRVLNPAVLPQALRSARAVIFPNNMPAPPRVIPTPEETVAIKRKCAETVLDLVPWPVQKVYFGIEKIEKGAAKTAKSVDEERERQLVEIEDILDVFADGYLNAHLLYAVVDLLVVRLVPEMGEKGVKELRAERLDPFT